MTDDLELEIRKLDRQLTDLLGDRPNFDGLWQSSSELIASGVRELQRKFIASEHPTVRKWMAEAGWDGDRAR